MYIVKILKRKDASSVIVAVVLALILGGITTVLTGDLAIYLSGIEHSGEVLWRENIVRPLIAAFLQVVLLEALLRIVIFVRPIFVQKKR